MAIEIEDPMLRIEHDHTQLDVLFENLHAIAEQSFSATDDPDLLEDIPGHWRDLHEEIARHFGLEERKVFGPLKILFPDLAGELEHLCQQHREIRRILTSLGQMMKGAPEEIALRKAAFDAGWSTFASLWEQHSTVEWKLLQTVHSRIEASMPAEDEAQGEQEAATEVEDR